MRSFRVGGAVRDRLLGLRPLDVDHVVVGSTPAAMRAAGYRQVGVAFPVFLHPQTNEEHALARTERKVGPGHTGFTVDVSPDVTLEQDLGRRDFTINAMAEDAAGHVIDPHGGRHDLSRRVLRHVSPAFRDDPLRVLRAARFASRFNLTVAPATMALLQEMTAAGELAQLSADRVWQELARGLGDMSAGRFVCLLRECGALAQVLPEVDALFGVPQDPARHPEGCAGTHTVLVVDVAARNWWPLAVRFAALLHDVGKALTPADGLPGHAGHERAGVPLVEQVCARLHVPRKVARIASDATREHGLVHGYDRLDPAGQVGLIGRIDALRDPHRLAALLAVAECDHAAHPARDDHGRHPHRLAAQRALQAVRAAPVAQAVAAVPAAAAAAAAHAARVAAVAELG